MARCICCVIILLLFTRLSASPGDSLHIISSDSATAIARNSGGKYYKDRFAWRTITLLDSTQTNWVVMSYKTRRKIITHGHICVSKVWERTILVDGTSGAILSRNRRKYTDTNCPPYF